MWSSPTTKSLDPIVVTTLWVGFPWESHGPATCGFSCNYPEPEAWTTEASWLLNCSGVKGPSKQAAFHATLDIHKPDIVLGCESILCNSMCTYEFYPRNYTVFRKDRKVNGGGVFAATCDEISYEIPDIDADCEMIWAGLHFSGSKPLYLASFYEPPNTTSQPLEALASSYNKLITLHKRSSPNMIIGGDLNLQGIDWEKWQQTVLINVNMKCFLISF